MIVHMTKRTIRVVRRTTVLNRRLTGVTESSGGKGSDLMTDATRSLMNSFMIDANVAETTALCDQRRRALSRAITLVESNHSDHQLQANLLLTELLLQRQETTSDTFRLGVAGPPGAGKSTLIEALGNYILSDSTNSDSDFPSKLAVLCIDPSSTVSGGSILGDKTRMQELSRHERAFVRPSANGGTFGGLAAYTHDVVSLCHAARYDLVVVETVGLGQSEVEIAESVDMLVLVVPPGGGDELQGVKKGILEVADLLVVNKADGNLLPAARVTAADYQSATKYLRQRTQGWEKPPVLLASAQSGLGMEGIWNSVLRFKEIVIANGELEQKRRHQGNYWMWKNLMRSLQKEIEENGHLQAAALRMEHELEKGQITPRVAAMNLLNHLRGV